MNEYEKKHLEALRKYLAECTVLLKKDGLFPVEDAGKIAIYGSGARYTVKGGTGSGEVNSRFFINVEEGLKKAGFIITSTGWLDAYDEVRKQAKKDFLAEIRRRAKEKHTQPMIEGMGAVMPEPEYTLPLEGEGDIAVYVLSRISGEGNDRQFVKGDILLTDTETRDILALNEKYERFMLVLNVGGPVDLSPVAAVKNILVLSQLGVETGAVLADILLGKAYPSGKLTTTWAAEKEYCGIGSFGQRDDTDYKEGIYVGYRWFDAAAKTPLFPFGYGLSFSEFEMISGEFDVDGTQVTLPVRVKNTGNLPGKEIVQLYVSTPAGRLDKPAKELAAWVKTEELAAGESGDYTINFDIRSLASYDEANASYVLEKGDYILRTGTDSRNTEVCGALRLDREVVVRKVRNVLGSVEFRDWKPENMGGGALPGEALPGEVLPEEIRILSIAAKDIPTENISYSIVRNCDEAVSKLTDEELALLNIGAFDPKGGIASIIGSASMSVAGAAGETAQGFKTLGVSPLVMADGPAGLRLSKQYFEDEKGIHAIGETMPETIAELMPGVMRLFMSLMTAKPKKGTDIREQYCTAIPIGTGIAQSWNTEFAKLCGDVVGEEMRRFGVHIWLAPALNIHRDIRCGRNFEYYSEDPLVSGKIAAAVTEGVQQHPGCGVTLKHYAANNQETNRYNSNSRVSERAMREIYLKGFAICIREAKPCALMTSYNLLNGVHTAQHKGLITDILRCEFGFDGIVMTDWVTGGSILSKGAKYAPPDAALVAEAGGNLFMPGSKKELREILEGIKAGTVSRDALAANATEVLRLGKDFCNSGS